MLKVASFPALALVAFALLSCATAAKPAAANSAPDWVFNPRTQYPEAKYVVAVGDAASSADADSKAMGALVAIFGQSVNGSSTALQHYSQAAKDGSIQVDKSFSINDSVNSSYQFKLILGAEIKERWFDGKAKYYSLAAMDKLKSSLAYTQLLEKDSQTVSDLTSIPEDQKNSLESFRRFGLAADIANVDGQFINILSVISPGSSATAEAKSEADLRAQQLKIGQALSFSVQVTGDQEDRIKTAIASVLAAEGFKTGDQSDAMYSVEANIAFSEVVLQDNPNKFARYVLDIKIKDAKTQAVLIPFSTNERAGQATLAEAESRAMRAAEAAVKVKFAAAITSYLSTYQKK